MPVTLNFYKTNLGFIDNWLVAGPQVIPHKQKISDRFWAELRQTIFQSHYSPESEITQTPVERGPLSDGVFRIGDYEGIWSYYRCDEDHWINHSRTEPGLVFLRSWGYTQVHFSKNREVALGIETYGPYNVWLNGKLIDQSETFSTDRTIQKTIRARFSKGANEILVRFDQVGWGHIKHAFSLRLYKAENPSLPIFSAKIAIPTTIPHLKRRNELENAFQYGYLKRDIFSADSGIEVFWPEKMDRSALTHVRLQAPEGWIYAEATRKGWRGDTAHLGHVVNLNEGWYHAVLLPVPREMYEENIRVQRAIKIWAVGNHHYSTQPYGTLGERAGEALAEAGRRSGNLYAEIAKMALGRWNQINVQTIQEAIQRVNEHGSGASIDLLGLLGMVIRFGQAEGFPSSLHPEIQACALGYLYQSQMDASDPGSTLESDAILRLTCELLAGQLYAAETFQEDHQTGQWHFRNAEAAIVNWIIQRGQYGFTQWDSDPVLAETLIALSHLIDLANSEPVVDFAGALYDKILVSIALNSFQGGLASCNGYATTLGVKGSLTKATSGIARLYWGQGIFNHDLASYVSAALLKHYELPLVIQEVAWSKEAVSGKEKHGDACKINFRTADFMLSSVQDYYPGQRGRRELLWQATLGPEAVIFTNHPDNASQEDASAPNYWLGNGSLPRLAQLQDFLIAIYNIPEGSRMDFSHAYFPAYAFDEYLIRKNWAFARKGDGYLALTASRPMQFMKLGQGAFRELRVNHRQVIWLCQMGSKQTDGDFKGFQRKILQLTPQFNDLSVTLQTLRGSTVQFGWDQPLRVDGNEVRPECENHYEYPKVFAPLPAVYMDVIQGEYIMRLNFQSNPLL